MATPTDAKTVSPALRRLFMPGRGVALPYLAGRENGQGGALSQRTGLAGDDLLSNLEWLSDLGYLWAPPGQKKVEPGIPSLMRHVLTHEDEVP